MHIKVQRPSVHPLHRVFPFLTWLPTMTKSSLKADAISGVTVAMVAIPQALAYAQLAGVPAYYGLYASFLPVIIGALFGSSPALSTGPVAMTSLLTAASVMSLAQLGTEQFFSYVILMALLSGIFQIVMGVARLGVLINFLSYPVLRGFINAAAIIIALAQLPAMLGLKLANSEHFMVDVLHIVERVGDAHVMSVIFGVGAFLALMLLKKYLPRWPGVLLVVMVTTLISHWIGFEARGGTVVGTIPQGLPSLSLPPVDFAVSMQLLPAAFVIAVISFMEAMSSSKIIAIKTRTKWDENQELIGQGLAKVAAAFSNGMPVSGSFSRSALNLASGAVTGMASVISALMVLITLLFFTPYLYDLPKPVLAAIIMMAVFSLIDVQTIKDAWVANKQDGIAAVLTFFATLGFAPHIEDGILTGIMMSLIMFLARTMHPAVVKLGMDKNGKLRSVKRYDLPEPHPQIRAIRYDGQLYFANVSFFEEAVSYLLCDDPDLRYVLVVGDAINGLDASAVEMLKNLQTHLDNNGVQLAFCNLKRRVERVLERTGLEDRLGKDNIFENEMEALEALKARLG